MARFFFLDTFHAQQEQGLQCAKTPF